MIELNLPGCKLPRHAAGPTKGRPAWGRLWRRLLRPSAAHAAPGTPGLTVAPRQAAGELPAPECQLDQAAREAWRDPVQYRRELLPAGARERRVLDEAAARSRWSRSLPAGRARGVALAGADGAVAACVVELAEGTGGVAVERIVAAVDCGAVIDLDLAGQEVRQALLARLRADDMARRVVAPKTRVEVWWVCSDAPCTDRAGAARSALAPALENALQALRLEALRIEALEREDEPLHPIAPAAR